MPRIQQTIPAERRDGRRQPHSRFAFAVPLVLVLVGLAPVQAAARSPIQMESIDGTEWAFSIATNGTVWIERGGGYVGDIVIPKTLGGHSVRGIGNAAFSGCSGLTSIGIPEGVVAIGWGAFQGCTGLKSIEIPVSVGIIGGVAFRDCSGLESVTIPDSVDQLNETAFSGCSTLRSVTISVDSVGGSVDNRIDEMERSIKAALRSSLGSESNRVSIVVVGRNENRDASSFSEMLEAKIKGTGLRFEKTASGNFRLLFRYGSTEGDRTQLVIVLGRAIIVEDVPFAEIRSTAVLSKQRPVDVKQMKQLLAKKTDAIGHWCLEKPTADDDRWMLYYSVKIPLSSTATGWRTAIERCSSAADGKERELTGRDDY